ncbi:formamidopyrimidine-DNA glycosylase [Actinoplanes tereljensis]|uniref:Formamidopyrimidine-DNA glycosylase n=1 Tax=Paractinoplanes tereljensis TaxID=571912 RepID=A0A919TUR5_9ACTN|nr:DNA-formamidopyrimidine glycosylase family protein [Actinoplanes tereljensis]GIF23973.1 formamidopyrimidine-DNA glycosylase [Actinoplanes tereljensis]
MPELPEVESARSVIGRAALDRVIADVDDTDAWVCRPHRAGDIRVALVGRRLTAAHRRGKSMWCDTSEGGPVLGIHLGMSGKIVIAGVDGDEIDGGDYWEGRRKPGDYRWARFTVTFADGGRLMLVDPRRLGRVRLDPPIEGLGPDAAGIGQAAFVRAVTGGIVPVKGRLLDQHLVAGIGNLLADQILWQAKIDPARPGDQITRAEAGRLFRATRDAVGAALRDGGVHTLPIIAHRHAGGRCPRDGAPMVHGTVSGRTTWWCSREQVTRSGDVG